MVTFEDLIPKMIAENWRVESGLRLSRMGELGVNTKGWVEGTKDYLDKLSEIVPIDLTSQSFKNAIFNADKPKKLPFGVSPRGAELYVTQWLSYLNFESIEVTPPQRDGGFDISADDFVVEVKNWHSQWIKVSTIREIYGVAQLQGKSAMIFSSGYLSEDAQNFAREAGVVVFLFNAEDALLVPGNHHAEKLLDERLNQKLLRHSIDISNYQNSLAEKTKMVYHIHFSKLVHGLMRTSPEWNDYIRAYDYENLYDPSKLLSSGSAQRLLDSLFKHSSLEEELSSSIAIGSQIKKDGAKLASKTKDFVNLVYMGLTDEDHNLPIPSFPKEIF